MAGEFTQALLDRIMNSVDKLDQWGDAGDRVLLGDQYPRLAEGGMGEQVANLPSVLLTRLAELGTGMNEQQLAQAVSPFEQAKALAVGAADKAAAKKDEIIASAAKAVAVGNSPVKTFSESSPMFSVKGDETYRGKGDKGVSHYDQSKVDRNLGTATEGIPAEFFEKTLGLGKDAAAQMARLSRTRDRTVERVSTHGGETAKETVSGESMGGIPKTLVAIGQSGVIKGEQSVPNEVKVILESLKNGLVKDPKKREALVRYMIQRSGGTLPPELLAQLNEE